MKRIILLMLLCNILLLTACIHGPRGDWQAKDTPLPEPMEIDSRVVAVSWEYALLEDGSVYRINSSYDGSNPYAPEKLTDDEASAITFSDETMENGDNPANVIDDAVYVVAIKKRTFAIKNDGTLWAWGNNENGELGDGTFENRSSPVEIMSDVSSVYAMDSHTFAITSDGSLWGWGSNGEGQLGIGSIRGQYERGGWHGEEYAVWTTPIKVMEYNASATSSADTVSDMQDIIGCWILYNANTHIHEVVLNSNGRYYEVCRDINDIDFMYETMISIDEGTYSIDAGTITFTPDYKLNLYYDGDEITDLRSIPRLSVNLRSPDKASTREIDDNENVLFVLNSHGDKTIYEPSEPMQWWSFEHRAWFED